MRKMYLPPNAQQEAMEKRGESRRGGGGGRGKSKQKDKRFLRLE